MTASLKMGLHLDATTDLADQVLVLNNNYDTIASKLSGRKLQLLMAGDAFPVSPRLVINSTNWLIFDPFIATALVDVQVGDWLEYNISMITNNSAGGARVCAATLKGEGGFTKPINSFGSDITWNGTAGDGVPQWRIEPNEFTVLKGKLLKQVVTGDLVDQVTLIPNPLSPYVAVGLFGRMVTAGSKGIFTQVDIPAFQSLVNLGK